MEIIRIPADGAQFVLQDMKMENRILEVGRSGTM